MLRLMQWNVFFPWSSLRLAPIMWTSYMGAQLYCEANNDLAALFVSLIAAPMELLLLLVICILLVLFAADMSELHWNLKPSSRVESREKGGLAITCQQSEKWSSHIPEKSRLWTMQIKVEINQEILFLSNFVLLCHNCKILKFTCF